LRDVVTIVFFQSILIAVGFTTLVGIIFGIYQAIKASKINPVDALRYE
jgi:ABC-type antimicrobial peptide transport system permease subunit